MKWFTADTHFGHSNIIKYCSRPFKDADEMDSQLIANWNAVVSDADHVYHLGDFTLQNVTRFRQILNQLNGHIHIVPGGHDGNWLDAVNSTLLLFYSKSGHVVTILPPIISIVPEEIQVHGEHKKIIVLCHYAMRVWDRSHYASWHLFGHSHGMLKEVSPLSMDVGVDCCGYKPISILEIKERFSGV